jgi:hypothetical protein
MQEIIALPVFDLRAAVAAFPELARANILAGACSRGEVSQRLLESLLEAWDGIDERALYHDITEHRQTIQLALPPFEDFSAALQAVKSRHAKIIAANLLRHADPHTTMRQLTDASMASGQQRSLLAEIVSEFETLRTPNRDGTGMAPADLNAWDNTASPSRSPPPIPNSLQNQKPLIQAPGLSDAERQRIGDIHATRLLQASQTAKDEYASFATLVKARGVKAGGLHPLGPYVSALEDYLGSGADVTTAAIIVWDLAQHFDETHNDPELAYHLLKDIQDRSAGRLEPEVAEKIETSLNRTFLAWNVRTFELQKGPQEQIRFLDASIAIAPKGARAGLQATKELIIALQSFPKPRKNNAKKYALIGVVCMFTTPFLLEGIPKWPADKSPAAGQVEVQPSKAPQPRPVSDDLLPFHEEMPPQNSALMLRLAEARYCVFQNQRLTLLRDMLTNNVQIERFNARLKDYKAHCSAYRSQTNGMAQLHREASERIDILRADARKLLNAE